MKYYLAVDIGASSGRHIVGYCENGDIKTCEVYRFENGMDEVNGSLLWDTDRLFREVKNGIKEAFLKFPKIESLSIDTWGVDYVLLQGDKEVKPTFAYRDKRNEKSASEVHKIIPFDTLYERTGIQYNTFNSIYQLYADKVAGRLYGVTDFLMIPEYLMYKLTGNKVKEFTDATTTGLVSCKTLQFDKFIFEKLGLPLNLIKEIKPPKTFVGKLKDEIAEEVGGQCDVVLCATHDTGSAVEAIDMDNSSPYISSGTWSLLGVKTESAINDEKSRNSGYSNEGGVGYNRYQINITGMWIIQSLRKELCKDLSWDEIVELAKQSDYCETFDVNDKEIVAPESMKDAICKCLVARGHRKPVTVGDYFNASYYSLAEGYKKAIDDLEFNTGRTYSSIYIVGGGAKNKYLNGLVEKITGKTVKAFPIEATSIGNIKVQMK